MQTENLYAAGMEIKEWVKAARKHKGLTQDQFGEALGMTKANVSGWETARHEPSFLQMKRVVALTGYPMPDGVMDVFTEALVERLKQLDSLERRRLEDELRVRYQMERLADASFQTTTGAKTTAQKSSPGAPAPGERRTSVERRTKAA